MGWEQVGQYFGHQFGRRTVAAIIPFPAGLTPADSAHQRTESQANGALIPAGLTQEIRQHAATIASAAKRLTDLRAAWLNPPEWSERVPETVPLGLAVSPYPDRIVARPGFEKELGKRTRRHGSMSRNGYSTLVLHSRSQRRRHVHNHDPRAG